MATLGACLDARTNNLAAVRMLAAVAVLWMHAWVVTIPGLQTRDFAHLFGFSLGDQGVHAFFILSGLLLTRSLMLRPDPLRFVVARFVRYLPAIFVSALAAAAIVGPIVTTLSLSDYFGSAAPLAFIAAVTTLLDVNAVLPGVFAGNAEPGIVYIPLWTVHYELVFSVALAAVGALGLLARRRLVLAGLVATLAVNVVWFWNGEALASLGTPHHLVRFCSTFGIGVAMAVFADRIPVSNRLLVAFAVAAVPFAVSPMAALIGMLLLAYAVLCIGFARTPFAGAVAKGGEWSYGFYVWGFLVQQCLAYAAPHWNGWQVFGASFAIALLLGALSWRFVERPMLGLVTPLAHMIRAALRRPAALLSSR